MSAVVLVGLLVFALYYAKMKDEQVAGYDPAEIGDEPDLSRWRHDGSQPKTERVTPAQLPVAEWFDDELHDRFPA